MMADNPENLRYQVTWLIRRLFRAMGKAANEYLADSGITAADRAVLEFLYPDLCMSVPDIAARYKVSRQHVQSTVNNLLDKGLVEATSNPRHRRSPLIRLHELGRQTFSEIRHNEARLIDELFAGVAENDVRVTHDTMQQLLRRLNWRETK